ncbi:MAG: hypothetical protein ACW981_16500 [Candidatus Hodarchaeales archaeon]|jgi:hypothetical protein
MKSDFFLIDIENNGIPISKEEKTKFNSYRPLIEIDRSHIGSSIIQRIIHAHNWKILIKGSNKTVYKIKIPLSDIIF